MNNKVMFFVINEEGIREDAQILAKYKLSNGNNYITYMNSLVGGRMNMSKNILTNDYYKKVLGDK